MKLMPIWILLLIFASAGVQVMYPTVDVIAILDAPWVQGLLVSMGLGGIPLSILKRVIAGAKNSNISSEDLDEFRELAQKIFNQTELKTKKD
jgi:hypothetical protein